MAATNKPHPGLRVYRLFLASLGLVILGLNIQYIVWSEEARGHFADQESEHALSFRPFGDFPYAKQATALLVPNISMFLMFLLLAIGRPRLNSLRLHSVCRILFSLTLVIGLIYWPALQIELLARSLKSMNQTFEKSGFRSPGTLATIWLCSTGGTNLSGHALRRCQTVAARDILSFIGAFLVVLELVFAGVVGEIGIHQICHG